MLLFFQANTLAVFDNALYVGTNGAGVCIGLYGTTWNQVGDLDYISTLMVLDNILTAGIGTAGNMSGKMRWVGIVVIVSLVFGFCGGFVEVYFSIRGITMDNIPCCV